MCSYITHQCHNAIQYVKIRRQKLNARYGSKVFFKKFVICSWIDSFFIIAEPVSRMDSDNEQNACES